MMSIHVDRDKHTSDKRGRILAFTRSPRSFSSCKGHKRRRWRVYPPRTLALNYPRLHVWHVTIVQTTEYE